MTKGQANLIPRVPKPAQGPRPPSCGEPGRWGPLWQKCLWKLPLWCSLLELCQQGPRGQSGCGKSWGLPWRGWAFGNQSSSLVYSSPRKLRSKSWESDAPTGGHVLSVQDRWACLASPSHSVWAGLTRPAQPPSTGTSLHTPASPLHAFLLRGQNEPRPGLGVRRACMSLPCHLSRVSWPRWSVLCSSGPWWSAGGQLAEASLPCSLALPVATAKS